MEETKIPYEQIIDSINSLKEQNDNNKWQIGDLLTTATDSLPKKKQVTEYLKQVSKDTNLDYSTLAQYRWVSKKFPTKEIRSISPFLTYSHYRNCASIEDAKEAEEWLNKSADEQWTVSTLGASLAEARVQSKISDGTLPCGRKGCENPLSLNAKERVSVQAYGYKYTCCSLACAANIMLNDLQQTKNKLLDQDIALDSSNTIMVHHPDKAVRDVMPSEDWNKLRYTAETEHLAHKYGNPGNIRY